MKIKTALISLFSIALNLSLPFIPSSQAVEGGHGGGGGNQQRPSRPASRPRPGPTGEAARDRARAQREQAGNRDTRPQRADRPDQSGTRSPGNRSGGGDGTNPGGGGNAAGADNPGQGRPERTDRPDQPGTRSPGVDRREDNQDRRIDQGGRSGQLTDEENARLRAEQEAIRTEEQQYKSDGSFTRDERKDVHQDLNAASKDIYKEKHDAETQPGVTPAKPGEPGTRSPGVNRREENQRDRIGGGVRSGQLTAEETKALAAEQKAIRKEEKEYKSDGSFTKEERKDVHQDLNAASKDIYKEKHDAEVRSKADTGKTSSGTTTGGSKSNRSGGGDGTNPGGGGNEAGTDNPGQGAGKKTE